MDSDGFAAAMARVDVIAYTPTEFFEEKDVTIGRCRDLVEKYAVTWVNVVGLDDRTAGELETLFGAHPLALDDARNQAMAPKVDVYDDIVFIIARAITWTEEIDTDSLSLFVAKKFLITVHEQGFAQLEDVRIRLRKKNPKMVKSGTDFLAYTILDAIVDSYFAQLDRFQSIVDQLEEDIIEQPSGQGISRLHSLRSDLVRVRNALRPQREMFAVLGRLEIPVFRNETRTYLRDVQEHTISALDTLDANRETVASLMEVQATLASNQMNEVIKVLTVIFTITLPIAIVSSAFGMNVTFYGFNGPEGLALALRLRGINTETLMASGGRDDAVDVLGGFLPGIHPDHVERGGRTVREDAPESGAVRLRPPRARGPEGPRTVSRHRHGSRRAGDEPRADGGTRWEGHWNRPVGTHGGGGAPRPVSPADPLRRGPDAGCGA